MKKKRGIRISILLIAALTLAAAALFVALPKRAFSDNENRTLAQAPVFSVGSALTGTFQTDFERFLADQFPMRDALFSLSVRAERLAGKREINGVFCVRDADGAARLIDAYEEPQNTEKFVQAVGRLADGLDAARVTLLLSPTAFTLYADELPACAEAAAPVLQTETIEEILRGVEAGVSASGHAGAVRFADVLPALAAGRDTGEDVFYRTDHHWTTRGAHRAYAQLAPLLGLAADGAAVEPAPFTVVSENFRGTTWSKVCDRLVAPDAIEIYENPAWAGTLCVTYEDTGETADSPYNRDYLNKKDQYSMFLNNLHPLLTIVNPGADLTRADAGESGRRALAVVGDSYKNSLVPFLIDRYETIYVFDPRYYRGGISAFVNGHAEIEDVLVVYNLGTMDADRGIGAID